MWWNITAVRSQALRGFRCAMRYNWRSNFPLAAAMLYLCSDETASVNGARIPVYGRA